MSVFVKLELLDKLLDNLMMMISALAHPGTCNAQLQRQLHILA